MFGLDHNFAAQKQKRDASLKQAADAAPKVVEGSGQPCPDGGLEAQAIVISDSPEMGLNDQSGMGNVTLVESREVSPIPTALQVVHPPEQATG